jgi:hypothetical protein
MTRNRKSSSVKPMTRRRKQNLKLRRIKGALTGQALVVAAQASPYRDIDIDIEPGRMPMLVRSALLWKYS